ncbi:hypothetical protein [Pseudomonas nitroreducens]|uniref:hypothetical protein n=1 Tax=Pseudomonas nitroreducens TaxID=46680 RepID=UPI00351CFD4D
MTKEELMDAFLRGWIVDGRQGGLIVGRLHTEGHIVAIQALTSGDCVLVGLLEGDEFILSPSATEQFYKRLHEINEDDRECDSPFPVSVSSRLLTTTAEPHDKLLLIDRQMIINRQSTRRYFKELEEMNNSTSFRLGQLLLDHHIAELEANP